MLTLPPSRPLAENLRRLSQKNERGVQAARVSMGVAGSFLFGGLIYGWIRGDQKELFLFLVMGIASALLIFAFMRWQKKRSCRKRLRNEYESLFVSLVRSKRLNARALCDNILTLVPSLIPDYQGALDHVGESFDFDGLTLMQLERIGPEPDLAGALEEKASELEALFIHLTEGLVEETDAQRHLTGKLHERLAEAQGRAYLLQAALETERIVTQDLKETERFLREIIGRPEAVAAQKLNVFLDAKRERRAQILGHFGDFLLGPR